MSCSKQDPAQWQYVADNILDAFTPSSASGVAMVTVKYNRMETDL